MQTQNPGEFSGADFISPLSSCHALVYYCQHPMAAAQSLTRSSLVYSWKH